MTDVTFADILIIALICALIGGILYQVQRGKNKTPESDKDSSSAPAEEKHQK